VHSTALEFRQSVLVGLLMLLLATDSRLDLVTSVDDGLENIDEIAPLVTDRVLEAGNVVAVAVAVSWWAVFNTRSATADSRSSLPVASVTSPSTLAGI